MKFLHEQAVVLFILIEVRELACVDVNCHIYLGTEIREERFALLLVSQDWPVALLLIAIFAGRSWAKKVLIVADAS